MAFQKEHLVIFFNPLQLEIRSTVIKLQFLWLPTFAPAAVSEALALHIHSQLPHLLLLGDSVLLLHPQYQACKCAPLSSLCRSSRPGILSWNLYFSFYNWALCTVSHMSHACKDFYNTKNSPCPLALYLILSSSRIVSFLTFNFFPCFWSFSQLWYRVQTL